MWENSVEKRFIRNIVFAVLCLVSVVALFIAMKKANTKRAEESASLYEVSTQKKAEQEQAISETLLTMEREYEKEYAKDMEAVAEYLPGIVCWGDTLTKGTSGNVSYPDTLQKRINEEFCNKYDLTVSLFEGVVYAGVDFSRFKLRIPVVNMGGGEENVATILSRAGEDSFVLKKDIIIPSASEPVKIDLIAKSGSSVRPLMVGDQGLNPVTIDGVEGTLKLVNQNKAVYYYTFTRLQEGEEQKVAKGTEVLCSNVDAYRDYVHVIWLGTYETNYTASRYVNWCEKILSRQTKNLDRYIVIGPCSFSQKWDSAICTMRLDELDATMTAKYGDHYISVRKYLATDGPVDAGITLTKEDKRSIALGAVPQSFRSADGSVELSSRAYELLGDLVFERMDRLGYFTEIVDELQIDRYE